MAAGLCAKVLVAKLVSMRSSRFPFWLATRMNEPSGAGYAACACRVLVAPDRRLEAVQRAARLRVEDHDVAAGDEREHRVGVLVVEEDHVRPDGIPSGCRAAQVGGLRAEIEPGDRLGLRGARPHQVRAVVDEKLAAEARPCVGLVGDPDLEAALAFVSACGDEGQKRDETCRHDADGRGPYLRPIA